MALKRIGVLTSGGDSPGMNAAIRAVVRGALARGLEVYGIIRGFAGLIAEEIQPLTHRSVSNIVDRGGTILKTSRCPEFMEREGQARALEVLRRNALEGLVVIGGDGSYRGALALSREGVVCVGVPGTIDNDLCGTDRTIGSDTAVETALEAIDKIKDTANSMERIFIVEMMGRNSGYLALQAALAGGAEQVVIPETAFDIAELCHEITGGYIRGKASWIIVVAEGAVKAYDLAKKIEDLTDLETRVVVLGHLQRGGSPTAEDRILGARLGVAAVELLVKGETGKAVGVLGDQLNIVNLEEACAPKPMDPARDLRLIKILT